MHVRVREYACSRRLVGRFPCGRDRGPEEGVHAHVLALEARLADVAAGEPRHDAAADERGDERLDERAEEVRRDLERLSPVDLDLHVVLLSLRRRLGLERFKGGVDAFLERLDRLDLAHVWFPFWFGRCGCVLVGFVLFEKLRAAGLPLPLRAIRDASRVKLHLSWICNVQF